MPSLAHSATSMLINSPEFSLLTSIRLLALLLRNNAWLVYAFTCVALGGRGCLAAQAKKQKCFNCFCFFRVVRRRCRSRVKQGEKLYRHQHLLERTLCVGLFLIHQPEKERNNVKLLICLFFAISPGTFWRWDDK